MQNQKFGTSAKKTTTEKKVSTNPKVNIAKNNNAINKNLSYFLDGNKYDKCSDSKNKMLKKTLESLVENKDIIESGSHKNDLLKVEVNISELKELEEKVTAKRKELAKNSKSFVDSIEKDNSERKRNKRPNTGQVRIVCK